MPKKRAKEIIIDFLFYFAGCAVYSVALNCFIEPNSLVIGGFSGLAIIIKYLFGLPVGALIFALNLPLFIISYKLIGKAFIIKSAIATALMSVLIDLSAPVLPHFKGDTVLAALAGGVSSGIGLALIFIRGASTGGTDIIAKLVSLKFRNISVGRVIMIADGLVIALSAIIYKSAQSVLYSVVMIFVSANIIDYIIYGSKSGKLLLAVTDKKDVICEKINNYVRRGVTIVPVVGAYTKASRSMLFIAVRSNEISKIYKVIYESDENAFLTLVDAREILGRGFNNYE